MAKRLFLMAGAPGSGKSTFAKNNMIPGRTCYISRDEVRFELVSETEPYFSKEKQVFNEFVRRISEGLKLYDDVIADATHLNEKSRIKILSRLYPYLDNTDIIIIYMQTPLDICLERNETRQGTRAYVPPEELCNMFYAAKEPTYTEYNGMYDLIYLVEPDGHVHIVERE